MEDETMETEDSNAFSLPDISPIIRKYRETCRIFALLLVLFGIAVIAVVNAITPTYTATATIARTNNSSMPSMGSLSSLMGGGSLGGLGSLLSQASGTTFDQYVAILQSRELSDAILAKRNLLPELFYKQWDSDAHTWRSHDNPIQATKDWLKGLLLRTVHVAPNQDDVYQLLQQNMAVDSGLLSSLSTVSWESRTPGGAERQLATLLREADNIVRLQQRRDVVRQIAYLNEAIEKTSSPDLKTALISVISQDQQVLAVLDSNDYYAVTVVDRPAASVVPTFPTIPQIGSAIVALSLLVWTAALFLLREDSPIRVLLNRLSGVFSIVRLIRRLFSRNRNAST